MSKINLTQSNVDKYLASTDEFWKTFQKSLKAPFSIWNDYKEYSKEEWAHECKTDDDMAGYLNIIFDNTPVLKGEFSTVYADGSGLILTNYRLFFNDDDGLLIIPLKDLIFYGERVIKGGDGWLDSDEEKFIIEYNINGKTEEIELNQWILPEWVEKAKNAEEYNDLDDTANSLLRLTFYDFEKKDLNVPKIEFLADTDDVGEKSLGSIDATQTYQKVMVNKKKWLFLGVGLFFLVYLFSGGANVPDGQKMFIDKWQRLKDVNDESGGKKHLKDNQSPIVKWYGEVEKNLSFNKNKILVEYQGIEFTLEPIWILEDDEIKKIKSLKKGDEVYFTGKLNGEKSGTLWGMLSEPEMNVISSKLTNIDETTIYYDIPPGKQVVIRTKSDYKKAVIGKWSDIESHSLGDYGKYYSGIMLELKSDFTFTEYDLKGEWLPPKDPKQTHHWEPSSYGTWDIHNGHYSNTGNEYWAVEIHYAGVTRNWLYDIELTEYENAIETIFYDKRLLSNGPGENKLLMKGDKLKKGKK